MGRLPPTFGFDIFINVTINNADHNYCNIDNDNVGDDIMIREGVTRTQVLELGPQD